MSKHVSIFHYNAPVVTDSSNNEQTWQLKLGKKSKKSSLVSRILTRNDYRYRKDTASCLFLRISEICHQVLLSLYQPLYHFTLRQLYIRKQSNPSFSIINLTLTFLQSTFGVKFPYASQKYLVDIMEFHILQAWHVFACLTDVTNKK